MRKVILGNKQLEQLSHIANPSNCSTYKPVSKKGADRKNNHPPEIIEHSLRLQRNLISVENEIDSHGKPDKIWQSYVLGEVNWIENNHEIRLGSPLARCLDTIHDISRHGGPTQGNSNLVAEAIAAMATFIKSEQKKAG